MYIMSPATGRRRNPVHFSRKVDTSSSWGMLSSLHVWNIETMYMYMYMQMTDLRESEFTKALQNTQPKAVIFGEK